MRLGFSTLLQALFVLTVSVPALARSNGGTNSNFPLGPNPEMTPGSYCQHPDSFRYPERIPYCSRDVSSGRKRQIIRDYNEQLGFNILPGERQQFKIDHLIPLCAGGSNESDNLWPQHRSVYEITDPLEGPICEKMAAGRLQQKRAIELLMRAKNNLAEAPAILRQIEAL